MKNAKQKTMQKVMNIAKNEWNRQREITPVLSVNKTINSTAAALSIDPETVRAYKAANWLAANYKPKRSRAKV